MPGETVTGEPGGPRHARSAPWMDTAFAWLTRFFAFLVFSLLAAILGVNVMGMDNNILTQIGLVVLIGLAGGLQLLRQASR